MLEIKTLYDISALSENYEVECKLAAGKDGKGELPKDFWPTYCSFANSYGGDVILGLKETKQGFKLNGISNLQKVMDDLWSTLNDPKKVSVNLLGDKDVRSFKIDGKNLIQISLPSADQAFSQSMVISQADNIFSDHSLGHSDPGLGHNQRHPLGWLTIEGLSKPLIDNLNLVSNDIETALMEQAQKARTQKRLNKREMIQIVLALCSDYYLTQQVLAQLLNRKLLALRKNTLKPLLDQGTLALAFPQTPPHSKQAYTAVNRRLQ